MTYKPPKDYDNFQELRLYFNGPDLCHVEPISKEDFENSDREKEKIDFYEVAELQIVEQKLDIEKLQNMETAQSLSKQSEKTSISFDVSVEESVCTQWKYKMIGGRLTRICTRYEKS
jgi:hypothetical protein